MEELIPARIAVEMEEITDIDAVGALWGEMEEAAELSVFQSWSWIGAWLRLIDKVGGRCWLLRGAMAGTVVGLGIVVPRTIRRHHIITSRALYLHEAGRPDLNMVIEYNGFLTRAGMESEVIKHFLEFLYRMNDWDELFMSGIRRDTPLIADGVLQEVGAKWRVLNTSPAYYVDLDTLRRNGTTYLDSLSRNTRYQIRRAIKKYENNGGIELAVANSVEEALEFLDRLKVLHQNYWISKGLRGSFANRSWEEFHRAVITDRHPHGEIQLVKITAGEKEIGYLYNLVKNGHVYMIQSGFNYERDSTLHPGYVCHALAIDYNLRHGSRIYDFLAGDARYKRSLASGSVDMLWIVLQKKRWMFALEDILRMGARKVEALKAKNLTQE